MKTADHLLMRLIGTCGLTLVLLVQPVAALAQQDTPSNEPDAQHSTPAQSSVAQLPDSPGVTRSPTAGETQQPSTQQTPQPSQPRTETQKPVGTAAAEMGSTTGVAASKPAGAAVAPAKQRRVRSILIKVGAIAGTAAAVGTVVALSAASPSKPPGSH